MNTDSSDTAVTGTRQVGTKRDVLIIGAGGVAQVVAHKCAMNNDVLGKIHIASRTKEKCDAIAASVVEKGSFKQAGILHTYAVDAMNSDAVAELIRDTGVQIVINVGTAFINMTVLEACIETGVAYIDTAIHENPLKICEDPPWYGNYEWKRKQRCADNNVTAILGAGFDPGVVNAYARIGYDLMDKGSVTDIDKMDINAAIMANTSPPTLTPKSTFVNSLVKFIHGKTINGNQTKCLRSNAPITCLWSAIKTAILAGMTKCTRSQLI